MKRVQRIIAVILSIALVGSMSACGGPTVVEEVESDKTQIYVGILKGGIGLEWLNDAIEKFEEKYKDTSFEEGKNGVQVIIGAADRAIMRNSNLVSNLSTLSLDVIFGESNTYAEWINKGLAMDITDIVTEKLDEYEEERSIADKLDASVREGLTVEGKIYGLPYWEGTYGMIYNESLFDEKGWFMTADGGFTNLSGALGAGPDGKQGNYDDGLPATYDEFFKLCDKIVQDNCQPLQWAGKSAEYVAWLLGSLYADYEGREGVQLNFDMDGMADLVKLDTIDVDTLAHEMEQVAITENNGYELARQEGWLYAVSFAERLARNPKYYDANTCVSPSFTQQDAQLAFIKNSQTAGSKPVAILVDGTWWENESENNFKETFGGDKYSAKDVYKWMPFPKATQEKVGTGNTYISPLDPYCFISAFTPENRVEAAKAFLQFCHTDEMMSHFTELTGIRKPYDYEVSTDSLTPFGKSVMEYSQNSDLIIQLGKSKIYNASSTAFSIANLLISQYTASDYSLNTIDVFRMTDAGGNYLYDISDFYKGMRTYRKETTWLGFSGMLK